MDAESLKSSFLKYLKERSSTEILITHFPNLVLDMAIKATMGNTIDGKPYPDVLEPSKLHSSIYHEWKFNYRAILNAYSPTSRVNMTFGDNDITPKQIFDRQASFDELFSKIDAFQIFTDVERF